MFPHDKIKGMSEYLEGVGAVFVSLTDAEKSSFKFFSPIISQRCQVWRVFDDFDGVCSKSCCVLVSQARAAFASPEKDLLHQFGI